jgi:hypothetical protein
MSHATFIFHVYCVACDNLRVYRSFSKIWDNTTIAKTVTLLSLSPCGLDHKKPKLSRSNNQIIRNMFLKSIFRRSSNKSGYHGLKKQAGGDGGSIFRSSSKKANAAADNEDDGIDRVLTMTMTEDEEDSVVSTNVGSPMNMTGAQPSILLLNNAQEEDPAEDEDVITFTQEELMQHELEHIRQLSTLEQRIQTLENEMKFMNAKHAQKCKNYELELELKDVLLRKSRQEIAETKRELEKVASTLIQTQHTLHENNDRGGWSIFEFAW